MTTESPTVSEVLALKALVSVLLAEKFVSTRTRTGQRMSLQKYAPGS